MAYAPLWTGLLSFALLMLWVAPTASARDAAELTAAGAELGIAHPTGFVLDVLLWRLVMLLPFGSLGFRAAMTTALWGAASMGLATQLALWIRPQIHRPNASSWLPALWAPSLMLGSATILRAFTETEVYASALCLSLLTITVTIHPTLQSATRFRALAALSGISFLTHTSLRAAIVLCGLYLLFSAERSAVRKRSIAPWVALVGGTVLLVAYFPLRARHFPWADWGSPLSATSVWTHLSAGRIRQAYSQQMFAFARVMFDLKVLTRLLLEDLGALGLLVACAGAIVALVQRQRPMALVVLIGLADFLYALFVNPMGARDRQTLFLAETTISLVSSYTIFALQSWVGAKLQNRSKPQSLTTAFELSIALPVILLAFRASPAFRGSVDGWSAVELYGGPGAIGAVAPRAIVLCESDDLCGASLFARVVEGERPDVAVLPRQHLWERSVWRRLTVALGHPPNDRSTQNVADEALRVRRLRSLITLFRERIRWEQGDRADELLAHVSLDSAESPVLARVSNPTLSVNNSAAETVLSVSQWLAPRETPGALSQQSAANVLFAAGMRHASPDILQAKPYWNLALQHDPNHSASWSNLAVISAQEGNLDEAILFCERSIAIQPQRPVAWRNLRRYATDRWTAEQLSDLQSRARAFGIEL